ncbi:hypothetical protein HispidOSU_017226, partial [Sigmodon hispidus]
RISQCGIFRSVVVEPQLSQVLVVPILNVMVDTQIAADSGSICPRTAAAKQRQD